MNKPKFIKFFVVLVLLSACAEKSPPTISMKGDENMYIFVGDEFVDPGVTATDYRGKDISDKVQVVGSVDDNAGYYTIDYLASDRKGVTTLATRNVYRGFRSTDLVGSYDVSHTTNNGGGTYNYTGSISANGGDIVNFSMDNSACPTAPVSLLATMNKGALQFDIPDQSDNGHSISNGSYNVLNGGTADQVSLSVSFQTFNGAITYDHNATWTKQ